MRFFLKTGLLVSILFGVQNHSFATHIVGGEVTYQYKGNNNYLVRLDLYVDCNHGSPQAIAQDKTAFFGVFDGGNSGAILNGFPVEVPRNGPQRVSKSNYNCISIAPDACVDHYWYEVTLNLPPRNGGYIVSFQRCCRNNTITNLVNPQSTGANYWTKIPDSRTLPDKVPNSSAVFKELPPNFLCTNYGLKFDHSAKDADGDSLAYDLFWPYDGAGQSDPRPDNSGHGTLATPPFPNIAWSGSYVTGNPIDGNPPLNIDPETGLLTLLPTKKGQYVVGIRVREYRKGVLISETKRDYQFNVDDCVIDVVASYYAPKFICGYTYKFDNKSTGAQRYHWDFGIPNINNDTSNKLYPTVTYPGPGKYLVKLVAYKSNCLDSFSQWVTVVQPNIPQLPADSTICKGQTITYKSNIKGDSYLWSTGNTGLSVSVSQPGIYWLQVTISTCAWRDTVKLIVDKDVVSITGDTIYCSDKTFVHDLVASQGMASYLWSTGATTSRISTSIAGYYFVKAKTIHSCPSVDTAWIKRYLPIQIAIRDTTVCPNTAVQFFAGNKDAIKKWSNGDTGVSSFIKKPGFYSIEITRGLCKGRDTFQLSNFGSEFDLGGDLRFCNIIDTILSIPNPSYSNIIWNGEVNGTNYHLVKEGKVYASILNSHKCPETDSINVLLFPNPGLNLGADTVVCLSINPVLDAGPNMVKYLWQDNSGNRYIKAYEKGLYWVEVTDNEGCRSRDSVMINKSADVFPSKVYMPNAFTPDGNGRNDLYPDNKYINIGTMYSVKLYNRWGEKIADYNAPDLNWDGNINGRQAPEGVYVFIVTWIGCDNEIHSLRGDFHLLR